jgi:hypothetical protein
MVIIWILVNPSYFLKLKKKSVEMKLSHVRNRKIFETQNSVDLTKISASLTELSAVFQKIWLYLKTRFSPIKNI